MSRGAWFAGPAVILSADKQPVIAGEMKIAIIGFSGCGKSTCFKAITRKKKEEAQNHDPTKPRLGAVKIPDSRLEKLKSIFNPKKLTPAEITFEDLPGFYLPQIKKADAVMEVLGLFSGRDPAKDIENVETEFMLSDLEIINNRLGTMEKELKVPNPPAEALAERETLLLCRDFLEKNKPLRELELKAGPEKEIRGFQFLSRKPVFILANTEENRASGRLTEKVEKLCREKKIEYSEFCAKLESEIADLDEKEKELFLGEMGFEKKTPEKIIRRAYDSLGYITFFTVKGGQAKAWPLKAGTSAFLAAGKIHSDIQKGFIKAEIIGFDDLVSCGSMQNAKKKGLLKLEPKEYTIRDGDVVDFRFSV